MPTPVLPAVYRQNASFLKRNRQIIANLFG
jgi:hypothetical protein